MIKKIIILSVLFLSMQLSTTCIAQNAIYISEPSIQEIQNSDFTARSLGSELQTNADLAGTSGATAGVGIVIGAVADSWTVTANAGLTIVCSKDGNDAQTLVCSGANTGNLSDLSYTASVTIGRYYRGLVTASGVSSTTNWIIRDNDNSFNVAAGNINADDTYVYDFISPETTGVAHRFAFNDNESLTVSPASFREITLDYFSTVGTRDATNHVYFLDDNTVRIVSDGGNMGIEPTTPVPPGFYRVHVVIDSIASGAFQVTSDGIKNVMSSPGEYWFEMTVIQGENLSVRRQTGGVDGVISKFEAWRSVSDINMNSDFIIQRQ